MNGRCSMGLLRNERGVALVTALMLTLMSLVIIMVVLYLVNQGTRLSSAQKRYQNSLEATYGGLELTMRDILPELVKTAVDSPSLVSFQTDIGTIESRLGMVDLKVSDESDCLRQKLSLSTDQWTSCADERRTENPKIFPDMAFVLKDAEGDPEFKVNAKIIDTRQGITNTSNVNLFTGGVTAGSDSGIQGPGTVSPYLYTVEIEGERQSNPDEQAAISVLYAY